MFGGTLINWSLIKTQRDIRQLKRQNYNSVNYRFMLVDSRFGREKILDRILVVADNPWTDQISNYMMYVAIYRTAVSSTMIMNYVVYVAAELQLLHPTVRCTCYLAAAATVSTSRYQTI